MAQRSIAAGALFSMCLGAAFFMLVFYVSGHPGVDPFMPLWYQVIKDQTATQSGVMTLPLILGVIIMSGLSGVIVVVCGYYTPLMILASICTVIGAGLLTTWTTTTPTSTTLAYQTVVGIGLGLGLVQPLMAAQVVLTMDDIPTGTTAMIFFQSLGGALFISAAQTIFNQRLISDLKEVIPTGISLDALMRVGVHNMKTLVPASLMPKVLVAFNDALTHIFYIPLVLACISVVGSLAMEWRSVKGVKLEMTAL
ncbi:MFS toxin efflux pump [Venturia nashicola]|uniref:MFS toxin efflux pump n=1 Tax=Venturia nashicola TaxID=86259 RepID=A0A4Z1NLR4_9PEZI|nr:MFS toxin efflux pump [Venturia nashicola]TLD21038.1 MFS toxin efflux pump [Venturia nashicola]